MLGQCGLFYGFCPLSLHHLHGTEVYNDPGVINMEKIVDVGYWPTVLSGTCAQISKKKQKKHVYRITHKADVDLLGKFQKGNLIVERENGCVSLSLIMDICCCCDKCTRYVGCTVSIVWCGWRDYEMTMT